MKDLLPSMGDFHMSINGIHKKAVTFNFARNTEHKTTTFYAKGIKKPDKLGHPNQHSVPVDLEEKGVLKTYLENEVEQYRGYILMQYIDNEDGSYQLKFADGITKERYLQTFMREEIDKMLAASKRLKDSRLSKPN